MTEFDFGSPTFRLFTKPTILAGMAMALDFGQALPKFNADVDPAVADIKALAADWQAIGMDLAGVASQTMTR